MDWNDLRYPLAIAETGTLAGAARRLGVNHSTVLRRLDALERALGARLFERRRDGLSPTEAGELLLKAAQEVGARIDEMRRQLVGQDHQLTGQVRVTTAFVVMEHLLPQPLARFARLHPGIEVEVVENAALADLSRRQADIAVRMSRQVPQHLVGRQLGTARCRVYALRGHPGLPQAVTPLDTLLNQAPWIGFERENSSRVYDRWMHLHLPPRQVRVRVDIFNSMVAMMRTGLGVGLLPSFCEPLLPQLVAVSDPIADLDTPIWMLTHPDLRRTARIQAFMGEVGRDIAQALAAAP